MSEGSNTRRPFRLIEEDKAPDQVQTWRVRLTTSEERGPVSVAAMRSLVEVGLLDESCVIRGEGSQDWGTLKDHPVWPQISDAKPALRLRGSESRPAVPGGPVSASATSAKPVLKMRGSDLPSSASTVIKTESPLDREVSSAMQERMETAKKAEFDRLHRQVRWHGYNQLLRWGREIFVFFAFLIAGDFLGSFATGNVSSLRWFIDLGIVLVALGYYVLFAIGS